MGELIAILRKTKGLTQRDLADMLNVSDKAISRWERGESYPDIELLPAISKIFNISADELISGKLNDSKKPESRNNKPSTSFNTASLISILLSSLGLIAAAIINNGLFRCYIAFFTSLAFYISAIFNEAIAINQDCTETSEHRNKNLRTGLRSIALSILLAFFSLPLVIFPNNGLVALNGESWLLYGSLFILIGLTALSIASFFISKVLVEKGIYALSDKAKQSFLERRFLKAVIGAISVVAILLTAFINLAIIQIPYGGTKFYDYDSFGEYMAREDERPSTTYYAPSSAAPIPMEVLLDEESITYYDSYGNTISKEEAHKRQILDRDGNAVYEYYDYNENVASIRYSTTNEGSLPITVRTYDDLNKEIVRNNLVNLAFAAIYIVEISIAFLIYFKKRPR